MAINLSRRLAAVSAIGALSVVALAGCSVSVGGGGYDKANLEQSIAEGASTADNAVTAVCPEEASMDKGTTFTCTATDSNGTELVVNVTSTGDGFDWKIGE